MNIYKTRDKNVYINIYDLTSLNCLLKPLGVGVYHSAVEIMGKEYSYGMFDDNLSSVKEGKPRSISCLNFNFSILIGHTKLSSSQIKALKKELINKYASQKYDIFRMNCHSFSDEFCFRLTGLRIPKHITRACKTLQIFRCLLSPKSIHGVDFHKNPFETNGVNLSISDNNIDISLTAYVKPLTKTKLKKSLKKKSKIYSFDYLIRKKSLLLHKNKLSSGHIEKFDRSYNVQPSSEKTEENNFKSSTDRILPI